MGADVEGWVWCRITDFFFYICHTYGSELGHSGYFEAMSDRAGFIRAISNYKKLKNATRWKHTGK